MLSDKLSLQTEVGGKDLYKEEKTEFFVFLETGFSIFILFYGFQKSCIK